MWGAWAGPGEAEQTCTPPAPAPSPSTRDTRVPLRRGFAESDLDDGDALAAHHDEVFGV